MNATPTRMARTALRTLLCALPLLLLSPAAAAAAATAETPARSPEARFDLSVHQAPATQVFLQIVAGSPWQLLLSPEVSGTVSLSLRNTSVLEALDALRELYGYHYRISGQHITS